MTIEITAPRTSESPIRGSWSNVRWVPNESTGETLNLGVVFQSASGQRRHRMVETFDRIACLYDEGFAAQARFLVRVADEALAAGKPVPARNVFLSESKFASGISADAVVDAMFEATVPLGKPKRLRATTSAASAADTQSVREQVLDALRLIAGVHAERLITSERSMPVRHGDDMHYLDIPLQSPSALGTIVSARARSASKNELELFRADSELQIARRVYDRDNLFMYVVRAESDEPSMQSDELFDTLTWKLSKLGVTMRTYTEPGLVAGDILEDMPA